ncbi:MAG: DivIVA domain-containing protein [Isoptericola variabilis]|nr:DivIVA domain-containing protein [Isoptericola variabilis]MBF1252159.1 DivIVA domain-containing protein [Isoptericola variabilis]
MGYDVSEVMSFLADVEQTITGAQTDSEKVITAQEATDVEFTVRLRGFDQEEVDTEIDRLIEVLRHLDDQRVQRSGDSVDDVGVSDSGQPVVTPDTEPVEMSGEYADFGTPEAVDQILRSMTQEKE